MSLTREEVLNILTTDTELLSALVEKAYKSRTKYKGNTVAITELLLPFADKRSNQVKKINRICGVLGGIAFAIIAIYFIPNIVVPLASNGEFRTWVDAVAIGSYVIAAVPMILLALLNVRALWRKASEAQRSLVRILLLAAFLVFSHIAMIFGMVDPGIAGYSPDKATSAVSAPAVEMDHHHHHHH